MFQGVRQAFLEQVVVDPDLALRSSETYLRRELTISSILVYNGIISVQEGWSLFKNKQRKKALSRPSLYYCFH